MKKLLTVLIIVSVSAFASAIYAADAEARQNKTPAAGEKTLKAKHAELECFDCHLEERPASSLKVTCSNCHGTPEDIAKLTENKYKEHYNPHKSLHYGTNALCENCHREHGLSRLECNNPFCHTEFQYKTP